MQGNLEQSEAHAAQAEALALSIGASFLLAMLQIARGISAIGAGRHWEAYEHLRRLFTPADPAFNSGLQFFGLADFVEAAVFSGNADEAAACSRRWSASRLRRRCRGSRRCCTMARRCSRRPKRPSVLPARSWLQGLGPAAKKWPFLRARLLLAYGGWLRRQRRSANARAPLREARDIFDALGASPWSDRAREELRASGESSRRRTEQVWETLTPQELHIAQLAAEGLSNKEIGARLYLSHRTVGYHLHRIFSKTGITSRSALRPFSPAPPPRRLTADPSSDWSFDRSGAPPRGLPVVCVNPREKDHETPLFTRNTQPWSHPHDTSRPCGPRRRHRPADRSPGPRLPAQDQQGSEPVLGAAPAEAAAHPDGSPEQDASRHVRRDTTEQTISQDGHSVKLYIMKPEQVSGKPGVLLFIHGGVWIVGNFENHQRLLRDLVVGSGQIGVFVEYTSLPEARFPTQLDQCYAALKWVASHAEEFGADGSRIAVAGNSVGGNMTAALTLMGKDRNGPKISYQVLLIPATDASVDTASYHEYGTGRFLARAFMKYGWDLYAPDAETRNNPYVSPLRASLEQLKGLPPALVITAENDPLRDEGEAYARKLKDAGVSVIAIRYDGTIHDFVLLNGIQSDPEPKAAIRQMSAEIKVHLAP